MSRCLHRRWPSLRHWTETLLAAAAGCGADPAGPHDLAPLESVPVLVAAELLPDVPAFKVDGRLRVRYALAPPFSGTREIGVVVLPAGERAATRTLDFPEIPGTVTLREITTSSFVPFLCGSKGPIDPRALRVASVAIDLCQP